MPSRCCNDGFSPLQCGKLTAILSAALLCGAVGPTALPAGQAPPRLVVAAKDVALNVAAPLPESVKLKPAGPVRLVEVDCPEVILPAQLVAAMADDGSTGRAGGCLLAVIPPRRGATGARKFRLEQGEAAPAEAQGTFQFKPTSDASLGLWQGEKPVLAYNHGTITKEDIPKTESRRSRACYVHPVWGLNGEIITDDFPRDHYHHHGIFWSWPYVGYDGKDYDLWMYRNIQPRFVRWIAQETGPLAAVLAVENGWFIGEKKVMIERVWLRAYRASETDRAIDLDFTWIPAEKPISLRGRGGKSYGGLTMRFDVHPRKDAVVTTPGGPAGHEGESTVSKNDLVNTPLPWADLTSSFPGAPARSGAAVFIHPNHPDYPPTWLTRHYGCLCVGWPGVDEKTFPPGKPFHAGYRVWIHKTALGVDELKQTYDGYTATAQVKWE